MMGFMSFVFLLKKILWLSAMFHNYFLVLFFKRRLGIYKTNDFYNLFSKELLS